MACGPEQALSRGGHRALQPDRNLRPVFLQPKHKVASGSSPSEMTTPPNTTRRSEVVSAHRYSLPVVREVAQSAPDARRELHESQVARVLASVLRLPE